MTKTTCKNCGSPVQGKFCSSCGQKVYAEKDKSLGSLMHEAFHFLTHFEGKFFKTLKTIYRSPGKLSSDYSDGIRQKYYKPVSLYLLVVVLYLLFPLASGMNMKMKHYGGIPIAGNYINSQIESKLTLEGISEDVLAEKFSAKSKTTSKILLLLLIPLSAPLLYLLYFNRKRYVFDNIILLTEISIFFLLTMFILIPIAILPFSYLFKAQVNDGLLGPVVTVFFAIYCTVIFQRVFGEKWSVSLVKGSVFCLLFIFVIISIYRIIVFEATFALL